MNIRRQAQRLAAHLPYILGVTAVVFAFYGTSLNGFVDNGHDSLACVVRYMEYRDEIAAGYYHPQLFNSVILGATHAFPTFYPPMGYLVALLAGVFVGDPILAVNISFFLSVLFSGWTAYYMGFIASNKRWGGVLAAAVLTTATYRFVNCYVRGALAESWVLVFLPLIIAGILRLIQGKRAWGVISLGVAGALLSHLVITLWFGPLLLLANIPVFLGKSGWRGSIQYALAGCLGLGLALWFIIPQQALLPEVHASDPGYMWADWSGVTEHRVYFSQLFELSEKAWTGGSEYKVPFINDTMSFHLGMGGILGAVAFFLILLQPIVFNKISFKNTQPSKRRTQLAIASLVLGMGICWLFYLLVLTQTGWFYWLPQKMGYLQFPWRLLGLLAVFHAFFLAYALRLFPKFRRNTPLIAATVVLILASVPNFVNYREYRLWIFEGRTAETMSTTELKPEMFKDTFESRVGATSIAEYTNKAFPVRVLRQNWHDFQLPAAGFIEGSGTIEAKYLKPGHWNVEVEAQNPAKIYIPTIYFSLWQAKDSAGNAVETYSSNGFLAAHVPKGKTTLTFTRYYPGYYVLGWALSAASGLLLIGLICFPAIKKRLSRAK